MMIPYGKQSISDDDIAAVVAVLKSDFLTSGPLVDQFEHELCRVRGRQTCRRGVQCDRCTASGDARGGYWEG